MVVDTHSKATKLDPKQTGPHLHPKCNNRATATCNPVHTPVNTPNHRTAAIPANKPPADTPPAGTSPVSKPPPPEVAVTITTTSNKLHKLNRLAALWRRRQTRPVTGTVSKVKGMVKMGMEGTDRPLHNLVMHRGMINKGMEIRHLAIMKHLMVKLVKLARMVVKVIPPLVKLHHQHLQRLSLVMFSRLLVRMALMVLLLGTVVMGRNHHRLLRRRTGSSRRPSSRLMPPHKAAAMANQLLITGRRMVVLSGLMVVLVMVKHRMGSSLRRHMGARMAVVTLSNLLRIPVMRLLRRLRAAAVVVQLPKLHLSRVDHRVVEKKELSDVGYYKIVVMIWF